MTKPLKSTRSPSARARPRPAPAQPIPAPPLAAAAFPIVGLGASAGGLEALEQFFAQVPAQSGVAFVVVQHLDPTHPAIMAELLQRVTPLKVAQARNRTVVRPDCVYVIPPNKDLSILHGVLHLLAPAAPRGLRLPIDFFFRALAADQRERSVGVILSGMGSDGTLGIRAIKEHAGIVLVQDPASAKFAGMPHSAIAAGLADLVAPAGELPAQLFDYIRHTPLLARRPSLAEPGPDSQLEKIILLLRHHTGHDFTLYKRSTLYRRIERRMGLHRIPKIAHYVRYLRENPAEAELLFKELLIGVTAFFRDPAVWEALRDEALPRLLRRAATGQALRAWVPGCSTGEEAYTLAMVFREALDRLKPRRKQALQIFATDLSREAIAQARQGFYPANIAADLTPERLRRFFLKDDHGYRVTKEIREMIIFAPQNLMMDPPFTKLDLLTCRNLLIYFTPELQKKIIPLFHYTLKPDGVLVLGTAESVGGFADLFAPLRDKSRIYRRQGTGLRRGEIAFPSVFLAPHANPPMADSSRPLLPDRLQASAEQWLLLHHTPAAVLTTDQGDILFTSGRTGRYLEPAAGKANWNVFVMAREGLRGELTGAFHRARTQADPVVVRRLRTGTDRSPEFTNLTVQALTEPESLRGLVMVIFTPTTGIGPTVRARPGRSTPADERQHELAQELQQAREDVQSARDAMQGSQEELKSMNEEMQSANEELQSTNEELTTSKEELQSLNEELQTVNAELQTKVDDLNAASNDMKNLLNSTEIATLFLDSALCVRRFTERATAIIKLIPGDIGRPITDLATEALHAGLAADAREVLRSLVPVEKLLTTRDGRSLAMRMMPYRTVDDRIDGVVITFTDVTAVKLLETRLRAQLAPPAPAPAP